MTKSFDIVLPVRKSGVRGGTDVERAARGLLPSLIHFGYPAAAATFKLVCPRADIAAIAQALSGDLAAFDHQFIADEDIAGQIGFEREAFEQVPGWFRQQIMKLALAGTSQADVVLILDADVVATRPVGAVGRDIETLPHQPMGLGRFRHWFETSATVLGIDISGIGNEFLLKAMGVTPEFLSTEITTSLIDRIASQSNGGGWGPYLMSHFQGYGQTWTEFSLYWIWYAANRDFRTRHEPVRIYKFVDDPAELRRGYVQSAQTMFIVLQSTRLSLDDCEPVYQDLAAFRA